MFDGRLFEFGFGEFDGPMLQCSKLIYVLGIELGRVGCKGETDS